VSLLLFYYVCDLSKQLLVPPSQGCSTHLCSREAEKVLTPGNRRDVVDDSGSEGDVATAALS